MAGRPCSASHTRPSNSATRVLPAGRKRAKEANPCSSPVAVDGVARTGLCGPPARRTSVRVPTTPRGPLPRTTLYRSLAHCLVGGSSVMTAATTSASDPPAGAIAARLHAARLSYIRPRVPSTVSTMQVHCGSPCPNATGSSSPSDTTRTGSPAGQYSSNQGSRTASPMRSRP